MKRSLLSTLFLCLATAGTLLSGCSDDKTSTPAPEKGTLDLEIDNVVGTDPLELGIPYTTTAGDEFTLSTFKYYLSNITLRKADGSEYVVPESYFLVDVAQPTSTSFSLSDIPAGDYTSVKFTIGVDSARNVSGAQTGALAPSQGMFWNRDLGYIFLKLAGTSPESADGKLTFDIGGFKRPNKALRTVSPSLNGVTLQIRPERHPSMHLEADVLALFEGVHDIRFAQTASASIGPDAVKIADNLAAGFLTVEHIHPN